MYGQNVHKLYLPDGEGQCSKTILTCNAFFHFGLNRIKEKNVENIRTPTLKELSPVLAIRQPFTMTNSILAIYRVDVYIQPTTLTTSNPKERNRASSGIPTLVLPHLPGLTLYLYRHSYTQAVKELILNQCQNAIMGIHRPIKSWVTRVFPIKSIMFYKLISF